MGGMTWHYFAPYQKDVAQALEDLREGVFRSGNYRKPFLHRDSSFQPRTIEQLWETFAQDDDLGGTHTIIDIFQVSRTPEMGCASPLPEEEIVNIFGTSMPDKDAVSKAAQDIVFEDYIERWQAIYLPYYENGAPSGLLFYGASGD